MVDCSLYLSPSADEVVIADEAAEQSAREFLKEDAAAFSCELASARVSRLGDMKIVRIDLSRREDGEIVGLAMCIEKDDLNYLGVYLGPQRVVSRR